MMPCYSSIALWRALFLAAALLLVQAGAFAHAVEHPFHAPDSLCKVYLAGEHLGKALPAAIAPLPPPQPVTAEFAEILPSFVIRFRACFRARAPPSLFHA